MKNTNLKEKLIKTAVGADSISAQNEKGITLVSLVITIVLMLILAGVAISIAIEPNGLFGQAENATEKWNNKVTEEQIEIDKVLGYLGIEPVTEITDQMPEGKGWNSGEEKPVDKVVKQGTRVAPIPKGYTASKIPGENSIQSGLVIYQTEEGQTEVTGEANSDAHKTAMETRNQFVWIPVDDINDMVMCKQNNITEGSYEENGETITTKICKLVYDVTENQITCKTHGYTTATEITNLDTMGLAGRVYNVIMSFTTVDSKNVYTYSQTFDKTQWGEQTYNANSGYREPAIVTGRSETSYDGVDSNLTEIGLSSKDDKTVQQVFFKQLTDDFTEMAKSVAKYGGFYVSRYEAGNNGASLKKQRVLVAGTTTLTGYNQNTFVDGKTWYGMYNTLKSSSAINKTAVSSHLIWGSQYDMIIKYLSENMSNEPQVGHIARQVPTQELTGKTKIDIMSNIYDLEGNNREWTAQANSTNFRVYRGGSFTRCWRW